LLWALNFFVPFFSSSFESTAGKEIGYENWDDGVVFGFGVLFIVLYFVLFCEYISLH
jgi:hypothetical protein